VRAKHFLKRTGGAPDDVVQVDRAHVVGFLPAEREGPWVSFTARLVARRISSTES